MGRGKSEIKVRDRGVGGKMKRNEGKSRGKSENKERK